MDHFDTQVLQNPPSHLPAIEALEWRLAHMENARFAVYMASGIAACTTLMARYSRGDHVICDRDVYYGCSRLWTQDVTNIGLETTVADVSRLDHLESLIRDNTKLIFTESPSNPLMKVTDLKRLAAIARAHNVQLAVDNSFLTSYYQRPLELGADIVLYSLSKYTNGHSDVIGGAIVTNDACVRDDMRMLRDVMGVVPSAFDCQMLHSGLKTLPLRLREHAANALRVGEFLESHERVLKVLHPALPSHDQFQLSRTQSRGHSGMLSFYLNGDLNDSKRFLEALKIFTIGISLGGFESLCHLPFLMSHGHLSVAERNEMGVTENLIRLSVGIENVADLIDDLSRAFLSIRFRQTCTTTTRRRTMLPARRMARVQSRGFLNRRV